MDNFDCDIFVNQQYKLYTYQYKGYEAILKHCDSATTDFDLTGQIIWPASQTLANYIIDNHELFTNKTVIQLGAGAGLSGLICAQFAKKVYLTDGNDIVMRLLDINSEENKLKHKVKSVKFDWSQYEEFYKSTPGVQETELLVGADILFWPQSMRPLCHTINYFMAQQKAKGINLKVVAALKKRANSVEKQFDDILEQEKLQRVQVAEYLGIPVYQIVTRTT